MDKIYIDTSVLGGCFDPEFKIWSDQLIKEFINGEKLVVISDLTLRELIPAPLKVKEILSLIPNDYIVFVDFNEEAKQLSNEYIREKVVSNKFLLDAQHIAIAAVNKVDILVSWNFKHIVNYSRIRHYNSINYKLGYPLLEIRSPREVLDEK